MLQVHLAAEAGDAAPRWAEALGATADVLRRQEAIDAGWFGERVDPIVVPRIGDLLVASRGRAAFYATEDAPARGMVGQHGSWTPAERFVPSSASTASRSSRGGARRRTQGSSRPKTISSQLGMDVRPRRGRTAGVSVVCGSTRVAALVDGLERAERGGASAVPLATASHRFGRAGRARTAAGPERASDGRQQEGPASGGRTRAGSASWAAHPQRSAARSAPAADARTPARGDRARRGASCRSGAGRGANTSPVSTTSIARVTGSESVSRLGSGAGTRSPLRRCSCDSWSVVGCACAAGFLRCSWSCFGPGSIGGKRNTALSKRVLSGSAGGTGATRAPCSCGGRPVDAGAATGAGAVVGALVGGPHDRDGRGGLDRAEARRQRGGDALLGERRGLDVVGVESHVLGLEAPAGGVLHVVRDERDREDPAGGLLRARPADLLGGQRVEPLAHDRAEGAGAGALRLRRQADGERRFDDVGPLGEHRADEALDERDRDAGHRGDLLGGQAGADVRLDLTGRQPLLVARHGRARDARPEGGVDGQAEAFAGRRGDDDRPVLDRQHAERLHADPTSRQAESPGASGCGRG